MAAAKTAGPAPSSIPGLLVQGDNRQELGHALAKALGFDNEADAANDLIKKAVALVRKR